MLRDLVLVQSFSDFFIHVMNHLFHGTYAKTPTKPEAETSF